MTAETSSSLPFFTATPILILVRAENARSNLSGLLFTTWSTSTRSYIDTSARSFSMAREVAGAFGYGVISMAGFPAATHLALWSLKP